jgi:hypothetical protein
MESSAEPVVALEDVWSTDPIEVNRLLTSTGHTLDESNLANKISLVKLYYKNNQLSEESAELVGNPDFDKLALRSLSVEQLRNNMLALTTRTWLNSMFNEKNLLPYLTDFEQSQKIYLFTTENLEIRSIKTLELEDSITLDIRYVYTHPMYYKGKIYFRRYTKNFGAAKLSSVIGVFDLETKEEVMLFDVKFVMRMIGHVIYYLNTQYKSFSYDVETGKTVDRVGIYLIGATTYDGNLAYVPQTSDDGKILSVYDMSTGVATLLRTLKIALPIARILASDGRLYPRDLNVYDDQTFKLVGAISGPGVGAETIRNPGSRVYTYDGKVYLLDGSTNRVNVYNSDTYEYLKSLYIGNVTNVKFSGDKLVTSVSQKLRVFDLNTGKSVKVMLSDPLLASSLTVN